MIHEEEIMFAVLKNEVTEAGTSSLVIFYKFLCNVYYYQTLKLENIWSLQIEGK